MWTFDTVIVVLFWDLCPIVEKKCYAWVSKRNAKIQKKKIIKNSTEYVNWKQTISQLQLRNQMYDEMIEKIDFRKYVAAKTIFSLSLAWYFCECSHVNVYIAYTSMIFCQMFCKSLNWMRMRIRFQFIFSPQIFSINKLASIAIMVCSIDLLFQSFYVVKKIITRFGWSLLLMDDYNTGLIFFINLPLLSLSLSIFVFIYISHRSDLVECYYVITVNIFIYIQ